MPLTIATVSGSLRTRSYNTALLQEFESRLPADIVAQRLAFDSLPLFNQDDEINRYPKEAQALKDVIRAADMIVMATPEFNRSLPGAFKNMLDWTSRPEGDNAWKGKKVYMMGCSSGNIGTAIAQYDLKRIMLYFGAEVLGQPEFYCARAQEKFSDDLVLTDEKTKEFLEAAVERVVAFAKR